MALPALPQRPSLRDALAVALLVQKRCKEAAAGAEDRRSELQAQLERLQAAEAARAAQPPPAVPPLAQLAAAFASSPSPPASFPPPDDEALQVQLVSLQLWHQAAALLPPEAPHLRQALAAAQRYCLLRELQEGPPLGLPAAAALERSPVRALLELAGDILRAHAEAEAAAAQAAAAGGDAPPCLLLSPSTHGPLLASAVSCAVQLCGWPGRAVVDSCYAAVQEFCELALLLATCPPPPAGTQRQQAGGLAGGVPAAAAAAAAGLGGPAIDLDQPSCQVAQQALALLNQSPHTGMVLLSCSGPAARDCVTSLAAAVLGEPSSLPGPPSFPFGTGSGSGSHTGSAGSQGAAAAAAASASAAAEEARLLGAFGQLSQQLSAGLRQLPQWMQATSFSNEAFLQELASAVMSARDAAQLISLTHPAAARQMQRVAAQLIGALQLVAAGDNAGLGQ